MVCQPARVSALGDDEGDFVQVELHGLGIGIGQRQRRACAARWTDRAEEVGAVIALVGRTGILALYARKRCAPPSSP